MHWKAQLIKHRGESRIAIYFEKNQDWINRIKQQEGSRWSQTLAVWHLPDTFDNRMKFQIIETPFQYPSTEGISQIEKFKHWLLSRRYSDSTIKTYTEALKSFLTFYNEKAVCEISNDDVIRYNNEYILNNKLTRWV
jgi:integrase/recombinase XerD